MSILGLSPREPSRPKIPAREARVFISYTTRHPLDAGIAFELKAFLDRSPIQSAFLDKEDLRPAEGWKKAIDDEIAACTHFVIIDSDAAAKSEQVKREHGLAVLSGATRLPIRIGNPREPFDPHLQAISCPPNLKLADIQRHFNRICRMVAETIGFDPPPIQLLTARPVGRLAHRLCDREDESGLFDGVLTMHRIDESGGNRPAALFVCGIDEDDPGGFVERVIEESVRDWVVAGLEDDSDFQPVQVRWPSGNASTSLVSGIKVMILKHLYAMEQKPVADDAFIDHICKLSRQLLIIDHRVACSTWDPVETPSSLTEYLHLWHRLVSQPRAPMVILFFRVVYSEDASAADPALSRSSVRGQLEKVLKQWRKSTPGMTGALAELPLVKKIHVSDWFDVYGGHIPAAEQTAFMNSLFASSKTCRMGDVVPALRDFILRA